MRPLLATLCLALAGCGRPDGPSPGPTSSLTEAQALAMAGGLSQRVTPPLSFGSIAPTGSMRPALDERSVVLFEPYVGQALRVGDLVEFDRAGLRVLHRVIEVRRNGVITQGDANPAPDGLVPLSAITRRYVGQIAFGPG